MMHNPDITLIGAAILDVLAGPVSPAALSVGSQPMKQIKLSLGGDALNEALALSLLGKQVQLISKVGQDEAGDRILDHLRSRQIPVDTIMRQPRLSTGINIVLVDPDGERFFLTNPESSLRKLALEDILPHADSAADLVCLASLFVSPLLDPPALEQLFHTLSQKPGRRLAADMTKRKQGETIQDLASVLPYLEVLFANREEAALLTGTQDAAESGRRFHEAGVDCAVIKLGAEGCLISTSAGSIPIPAYPVPSAVDTTGAGDCFAAGFLYALHEGMSYPDCGCYGCAAASCSVEQVGAVDGLTDPQEIHRRFQWLKAHCQF